MANQPNSPPDGWNMTSGTWGVQATALGSSGIGSGGIVLQAVGSTSCTIVSDWISLDTATSNVAYIALLRVYANRSQTNAKLSFVTYAADKATAQSTGVVLHNGTFAVVNFSTLSGIFKPNGAPFGRWELTVSSLTPSTLNVIQATVERVNPNNQSVINTAQTGIGAQTTIWQPIQWTPVTIYELPMNGTPPTQYIAPIKAGCYMFAINLALTASWVANSVVQMRLWNSTSSVIVSPIFRVTAPILGTYVINFNVTHVLSIPTIDVQQYYEIDIIHNNTNNVSTVAGASSLSVALLN